MVDEIGVKVVAPIAYGRSPELTISVLLVNIVEGLCVTYISDLRVFLFEVLESFPMSHHTKADVISLPNPIISERSRSY